MSEMPWERPPEEGVASNQALSARASTLLESRSLLDATSEATLPRLTSIVCTIGPATQSVEMLEKMMEAGMNVARLNFSHGTHDYHDLTLNNIRTAVQNYSRRINRVYPLAVALDTKGPEIRTGNLLEGGDAQIELKVDSEIKLTIDPAYIDQGTSEVLYIDYPRIVDIVNPGDIVFVDDGQIALCTKEKGPDSLLCTVVNGGRVAGKRGVNLPGLPVDLPAVTEKDKQDLAFGAQRDFDMVFPSFVRDAAAVREVRQLMGDKGRSIMIMPKIECHQGVLNIDEIIAEADGIMVARGDLGIEIPVEKVPIAYHCIVAKCNLVGKPVICATNMLESMVYKPRPTRAEIMDVAGAVLSGADLVMLSAESAKGMYPLECVRTMAAICRETERAVYHRQVFGDLISMVVPPLEPTHSLAIAAVQAAVMCDATAIICTTTSGRSAQLLSRYRPPCPVVAVTRFARVARQLQLYRSVLALLYISPPLDDWLQDVDSRVQYGVSYGKQTGFVRPGDAMVLMTGWRAGSGFTNTLRIVYASI
ncbi:pyruvate kinase-like [Bacillus rossius redtenbacheri]|uniref:pyruvate kinase-like n=1 Tax=Bacillus rossius redtenbacheri TaxID=93214 RepID=UPI002FDC88D6